MIESLILLGKALVGPMIRGVGGWLENATEDGQITGPEWGMLGATLIRVGVQTAGLFYGLNGLGVDVDAFAAGMSAVVLDFVLHAVKKKKA